MELRELSVCVTAGKNAVNDKESTSEVNNVVESIELSQTANRSVSKLGSVLYVPDSVGGSFTAGGEWAGRHPDGWAPDARECG